jgi:hypothetical protein
MDIVHDMDRPVARVQTLRHERRQDFAFIVLTVEKRAGVTTAGQRRSRQGDGFYSLSHRSILLAECGRNVTRGSEPGEGTPAQFSQTPNTLSLNGAIPDRRHCLVDAYRGFIGKMKSEESWPGHMTRKKLPSIFVNSPLGMSGWDRGSGLMGH